MGCAGFKWFWHSERQLQMKLFLHKMFDNWFLASAVEVLATHVAGGDNSAHLNH
jgi:hypothetical protein